MRSQGKLFWTAVIAVTGLALGAAAAQESQKLPEAMKPAAPTAGKAGEHAMPPAPKPGPEQAILKRDEGIWDARVEMHMGSPGAPPEVTTGVETNTLVGGLWLVSDFKGTMGEQPFHGHGTFGYDTSKKKYVGIWVDSMSTTLAHSEGNYDAATSTLTMMGEGVGEDGKPMRFREVVKWTDPNNKVFTMYMPGPDGREVPGMTITYKRKS